MVRLWWSAGDIATADRRIELDKLLRRVLAAELGCRPEQLQFGREAKGRPFLDWQKMAFEQVTALPDFNLSDTRGGRIVAICRRGRIGVDLERIDRHTHSLALAKRYFSDNEMLALQALEDSVQSSEFIRLWTAKEAACKATGTGIFGWLDQWQFRLDNEQPALTALPIHAGNKDQWQFIRLMPQSSHTVVIALWNAALVKLDPRMLLSSD